MLSCMLCLTEQAVTVTHHRQTPYHTDFAGERLAFLYNISASLAVSFDKIRAQLPTFIFLIVLLTHTSGLVSILLCRSIYTTVPNYCCPYKATTRRGLLQDLIL